MIRSLSIAGALAVLTSLQAHATTTFDFETFADGDGIGSVTGGGVTATITAFKTSTPGTGYDAVGFDTSRVVTNDGDKDLLWPFDGNEGSQSPNDPANDLGIVAILAERNTSAGDTPSNDRAQGLPGTMRFVFDKPVSFISLDALDFGDQGSISLFLDGTAIAPAGTGQDGLSGNNLFETFVASAPTAFGTTLDVVFGTSGAIDNLEVQVIPLPLAGWMLLSAFGVAAGIRRYGRAAA